MSSGEASLLPLFLKLDGRRALVVGAGPVAQRKVASLLEARARVRLVAPDATAELKAHARDGLLEWVARRFEEGDEEGAWLVVSATGDPETQRRVTAAADARRIAFARSLMEANFVSAESMRPGNRAVIS